MSPQCEPLIETLQSQAERPPPIRGGAGRPAQSLMGNEGVEHLLDGGLWVETRSLADLSSDAAQEWDHLADEASSPNVFYERWNLLQALEHVAPEDRQRLELVLVYRRARNPEVKPRLCGLFPLIRGRCARLPLGAWRLWRHKYAYLQTPLIRTQQERPVLEAFLDWASSLRGGPGILHWSLFDGEGPIAQALTDLVHERGLIKVVAEHRSRAMLRRKENWEDAAAVTLGKKHRGEVRRLHRRLQEQGPLMIRSVGPGDDLSEWQESFLRLESAGWKGNERTALAVDPRCREYFLGLSAAAHRAGKLLMSGLFLHDEPLALRIALQSGCGSFAWKIAYNERFAKFSPGVQLEIDSIRVFHEETNLQWMDSCASTQHFMINRLWSDRRMVQHVLVSLGGRIANLAVGGLPLARAIKRSLQRRSKPVVAEAEVT